ncbi:hypothetical protein MHYP_G00011010 [Metynnis hypsauchen]
MAAARAQRTEQNSRSPASSSSSVSGLIPLRPEQLSPITEKWRSVQFQLQLIVRLNSRDAAAARIGAEQRLREGGVQAGPEQTRPRPQSFR